MSTVYKPGDKAISHRDLNRFGAAADRVLTSAPAGVNKLPGVLVKNSSGGDLDRFNILGLEDLVIDPASFLSEFKNTIAITGDTPAQADHWGSFAVLLEPIADGKVGRAAISGLAHVQIDMKHADHTFADVLDTDATKLRSTGFGSAKILAVESGTGTKWAIVNLQARGAYTAPIKLTGNLAINSSKFKYAWSEVLLEPAGTAATVTGGLSGTTSADWALNRREINHAATGIVQGVDIDHADYPDGYAPRPVDGGGDDNTHQQDIIVDAELIDGQVWFSESMSHDGACDAP